MPRSRPGRRRPGRRLDAVAGQGETDRGVKVYFLQERENVRGEEAEFVVLERDSGGASVLDL